jgi:glutamate-ammonia-ligase adenylyltransferase
VIDTAAAERARDPLPDSEALERAWPALAPVFAASPYLAGLARRDGSLARTLDADENDRLAEILQAVRDAANGPPEAVAGVLRAAKAQVHLLIALTDLGGVWSLDQVTGAMTRFADAVLQVALASAATAEAARGRLTRDDGEVPGLFVLAMGKHGAHELNYSSDIDVSFFFDPERLPAAPGTDPQALAVRLAQATSNLLNARTAEGYVLRTDLRLRPDPGSTPVAVSVPAALVYYETVGQNWERAAFIKARVAAGDPETGAAFLEALRPYIWRRSLDYGAIADIHSIKRQILAGGPAGHAEGRIRAPGADLKRGRGGIREIEFYVQTQQLILGGRDPTLRSSRTLDALAALNTAGHVSAEAAEELAQAYLRLRAWEHRVQMLHDEQTHRLPAEEGPRRAVAALSGFNDLRRFDRAVARTLTVVDRRYAELFAEEEPLSSRFGSLVFTGVEDDEETLRTLERMGFAEPARVSSTIRDWHHGRIRATATARGRELFTRLAPRLLEAARRTGAPDAAFIRFAEFFSGLSSSVSVQSLFLAEPALFELVVEVMAFAPDLARTLSRRPETLDAMLDGGFLAPLADSDLGEVTAALTAEATSLEAAMDGVRRAHREQSFRIGVQVLTGAADGETAGRAYSDLADSCVRALAPAALAEVERGAGAFPGQAAVAALGKLGSREMSARSDLDLLVLYAAPQGAASAVKGWRAETVYGRFAQRLVAALSAPTEAGAPYTVDLRLRPSGSDGPVAVSLDAFADYHAGEAETWEALALTRARVVWATTPAFRRGGGLGHGVGVAPAARPGADRRRCPGHAGGHGRGAPADGLLGPEAQPGRIVRHRVHRPAPAARWRGGGRSAPSGHARRPGRSVGSGRGAAQAPGGARPSLAPAAGTVPTDPGGPGRGRRSGRRARALPPQARPCGRGPQLQRARGQVAARTRRRCVLRRPRRDFLSARAAPTADGAGGDRRSRIRGFVIVFRWSFEP